MTEPDFALVESRLAKGEKLYGQWVENGQCRWEVRIYSLGVGDTYLLKKYSAHYL